MTTLPAPLVLPAATLDDLGADDSSSQTASLAGSSTPPGSHQPAPLAPKDITVTLPDDLVEPENFAQVAPHLYRSSFPKPQHFAFLKTLGLKTVVSLVQDEYPSANNEFLEREGIKFYKFGIPGGKEPSGDIPVEKIVAALNVVFDVRNLPILVHCNKGKHRTGCLVGCLRRAQNWANEDILAEYQRYSFPKSRTVDQEFIESFSRRNTRAFIQGVRTAPVVVPAPFTESPTDVMGKVPDPEKPKMPAKAGRSMRCGNPAFDLTVAGIADSLFWSAIYVSTSHDPHFNLAFEDWIFRKTDPESIVLYMYRNKPSVIIGRNQDLGNTNYCVFVPREQFERRVNAELVARALNELKVPAEVNERNDIVVEGFKMSPHFSLVNKRAYHHGTMLIDAKLRDLKGVLGNTKHSMVTKGVASVSSPVKNIVEWRSDMSHDSFVSGVVGEFRKFYGGDPGVQVVDESEMERNEYVKSVVEELRSWDWQYGQTPEFHHTLRGEGAFADLVSPLPLSSSPNSFN
ncbi:hypothetical protein MNV49_007723 [Pseudohyphozyma bogoriensis]|nr:hypothetical protein MNV49_007723 [Pseudohyphozyma bogoriensis]